MKNFTVVPLIAAVFMLFAGMPASAGNNDAYKVVLNLKDGRVIEGYIRTSLMDGKDRVGISAIPNGSYDTWTTSEIISLVYPPTETDTTTVIYVPSRATKRAPTVFGTGPEYRNPVLMRLIYEGKNVDGYVIPCLEQNITPSVNYISNTYRYYYKVKGEDVAKAYWFDASGVTTGVKAALKLCFKEFPGMVELIEDNQIPRDEFLKNPEIMVFILDDVLETEK